MKPNLTAIPQGTRTYLFEAAAGKRFLEQVIHMVLRSRGFQEIVTPPFEYFESASIGMSQGEKDRLIQFTEGDSGRSIALRPDITSQVARSAATHLNGRPLPLRLCYSGMVFRRAKKQQGDRHLFHQGGFEIIGHKGIEADVEIILSAVNAVTETGLPSFTISLGHAGFISALLEPLSDKSRAEVKKALAKKDKAAVRVLLEAESLPAEQVEGITAITSLFGTAEVLEKAAAVASGKAANHIKNLTEIYNQLLEAGLEEHITIDLGEVRGLDYYTGINMELFSPSGRSLGSGGRYDNLVARYGVDLPAVGFGFDVDELLAAAGEDGSLPAWHASDILLIGSHAAIASSMADKLRQLGFNVTLPLVATSKDDAVNLAIKMNIPNILEAGSNEAEEHMLKWHMGAADGTMKLSLEDFLQEQDKNSYNETSCD